MVVSVFIVVSFVLDSVLVSDFDVVAETSAPNPENPAANAKLKDLLLLVELLLLLLLSLSLFL